jgi:hypothetical protein
MKIISLMNGRECVVEDDEAENVKKVLSESSIRFISLRSGETINTTSIVSISPPEMKPFLSSYPVYETKSGMYIIRNGERAYLEPIDIKEIKYKQKEYGSTNMFRKISENKQVLLDNM